MHLSVALVSLLVASSPDAPLHRSIIPAAHGTREQQATLPAAPVRASKVLLLSGGAVGLIGSVFLLSGALLTTGAYTVGGDGIGLIHRPDDFNTGSWMMRGGLIALGVGVAAMVVGLIIDRLEAKH